MVSDIANDRNVMIKEGRLYHWKGCKRTKHILASKYKEVEDILDQLEDKSYTIAIHPGYLQSYGGQPLAIGVEPVINYEQFPDHPHLNTGSHLSNDIFIPDTFCYTENIIKETNSPEERYTQAFSYITVWCLRHMIWKKVKEVYGKGIWIGVSGKPLEAWAYPLVLNRFGKCRCGSTRLYQNCHLKNDIQSFKQRQRKSQIPQWVKNSNATALFNNMNNWTNNIKIPQEKVYRGLKRKVVS